MGTVTVHASVLESVMSANGALRVRCRMNKQQIKSSIKSMLHHVTDAEWSDIIEELTPDLLDELVEEKIQQKGKS